MQLCEESGTLMGGRSICERRCAAGGCEASSRAKDWAERQEDASCEHDAVVFVVVLGHRDIIVEFVATLKVERGKVVAVTRG